MAHKVSQIWNYICYLPEVTNYNTEEPMRI